MAEPKIVGVTGDDSVYCGICGHETSLAMWQHHLTSKHDFDPEELAEAILSAEIVDLTTEPENPATP